MYLKNNSRKFLKFKEKYQVTESRISTNANIESHKQNLIQVYHNRTSEDKRQRHNLKIRLREKRNMQEYNRKRNMQEYNKINYIQFHIRKTKAQIKS